MKCVIEHLTYVAAPRPDVWGLVLLNVSGALLCISIVGTALVWRRRNRG